MATAGEIVLTGTGLPSTRPGGRDGGCLGEVLFILSVRIAGWGTNGSDASVRNVCSHNPAATTELLLA